MPVIEKIKKADGSFSYRVRISVNGKRTQETFDSEEAAKKFVAELVSGRLPKTIANQYQKKIPLAQIYEPWLEYKKLKVRGSSVVVIKTAWKRLAPFHGRTLDSLTKIEMEIFFKGLSRMSATTFAAPARALEEMSLYAEENLNIPGLQFNLREAIKSYTPEKRISTEFLTQEEFQHVLKIADDNSLPINDLRPSAKGKLPNWLPLFLKLAVASGMRRSELLGLRWKNVDFQKKLILVRDTVTSNEFGLFKFTPDTTKTTKSRRDIPMTSIAEKALLDLKERHSLLEQKFGRQFEFVFASALADDGFVGYVTIGKVIVRLMRLAEKKGISTHKFRTTFVTLFLERADGEYSEKIQLLKDLVGHKTAEMVLIYAKAKSSRAVDALNVAFGDDFLEDDKEKKEDEP